jgi:hypothetical protein
MVKRKKKLPQVTAPLLLAMGERRKKLLLVMLNNKGR